MSEGSSQWSNTRRNSSPRKMVPSHFKNQQQLSNEADQSKISSSSSSSSCSSSSINHSSIVLDESMSNMMDSLRPPPDLKSQQSGASMKPRKKKRPNLRVDVGDIGHQPDEFKAFVFDEERRVQKQMTTTRQSEQDRIDNQFLQSFKRTVTKSTNQLHTQQSWIVRFNPKSFDHIVISTSTSYYQAFRMVYIWMCFASSFDYAFQATFVDEPLSWKETTYEIFFAVVMLLTFITEYQYPTSERVERRIEGLAKIYLRGRFIWDLVALLPIFEVLNNFVSQRYSRLAFLLKLTRLFLGFAELEKNQYIKQIKWYYGKIIKDIIDNEPERAEDETLDNTYIHQVVFIGYIVRTLRLIGLILCVSFLTGLIWYNVCDLLEHHEENSFLVYYNNFESSSVIEQTVTLTYFVFTTVSTVGFGDYHPISDLERLLGAFILLFGVAITSYIMENLNKMISQIGYLFKDFEQNEQLSLFLKTLEHFNENDKLDIGFSERLVSYFEYRWTHNKNNAISTQEDEDLLIQLPEEVQNKIYTKFLFKDFIKAYSKMFATLMPKIQNRLAPVNPREESAGTSNLDEPKSPMISQLVAVIEKMGGNLNVQDLKNTCLYLHTLLLRHLEPQQLTPQTTILRRGDEVSQVIFMMDGELEVGYNHWHYMIQQGLEQKQTTNLVTVKQRSRTLVSRRGTLAPSEDKFHYPVNVSKGFSVGTLEMTFTREAQFHYRTLDKPTSTFFIRRKNWKKFLEQLEEEADAREGFQKKILQDYVKQVYLPIQAYQQEMMGLEKQKQEAKELKAKNALEKEQENLKSVYKNPLERRRRDRVKQKSSMLLLNSVFRRPSNQSGFQSMNDLSQIQKEFIEYRKMNTKESLLPGLPGRYISQKISNLEVATITSNVSGAVDRPAAAFASEVKDAELKALIGKVFDTSFYDFHSGNLSQFQQKNSNIEEMAPGALFNLLVAKLKKSQKLITDLTILNRQLGDVVLAQRQEILELEEQRQRNNISSPLDILVRNEENKNFGQNTVIQPSDSESGSSEFTPKIPHEIKRNMTLQSKKQPEDETPKMEKVDESKAGPQRGRIFSFGTLATKFGKTLSKKKESLRLKTNSEASEGESPMSGSSSRILELRKDKDLAFSSFTNVIPEDNSEDDAEFPIIKEVAVHEECSPVNKKQITFSTQRRSSPHFPYLPLKAKPGLLNFEGDASNLGSNLPDEVNHPHKHRSSNKIVLVQGQVERSPSSSEESKSSSQGSVQLSHTFNPGHTASEMPLEEAHKAIDKEVGLRSKEFKKTSSSSLREDSDGHRSPHVLSRDQVNYSSDQSEEVKRESNPPLMKSLSSSTARQSSMRLSQHLGDEDNESVRPEAGPRDLGAAIGESLENSSMAFQLELQPDLLEPPQKRKNDLQAAESDKTSQAGTTDGGESESEFVQQSFFTSLKAPGAAEAEKDETREVESRMFYEQQDNSSSSSEGQSEILKTEEYIQSLMKR